MQRWRILVCSDELDTVTELSRAFRAAGHGVATARDGNAALAEALATTPSAVVADVAMPGLNGFQLSRRLRAELATAACPIFLLSSKLDAADRYWAEQVGATALVPRPADPAALLAQISLHLGGAPAQRRTTRRFAAMTPPTGVVMIPKIPEAGSPGGDDDDDGEGAR